MKRKLLWKILLLLGLCPFIIPVVMSPTRMSSWSFLDWLVLWSYVYWPTYLVGLALVLFAAYKLTRHKKATT